MEKKENVSQKLKQKQIKPKAKTYLLKVEPKIKT